MAYGDDDSGVVAIADVDVDGVVVSYVAATVGVAGNMDGSDTVVVDVHAAVGGVVDVVGVGDVDVDVGG